METFNRRTRQCVHALVVVVVLLLLLLLLLGV